MPYDSQITRTDGSPLIPEEVNPEIFQGIVEQSAFLSLMRRLPTMSRKQQRMAVLSALPTAYFVNGDTNLKQTTELAWANKYLNAEEIAAVVPIPQSVLDDSEYDIWAECKPRILEAASAAIDAAVGFGTNKPTNWPDAIYTAAVAASNNVAFGAVGVDLYDDLLGDGGVISKIEAEGFFPNGHVAALSMRAKLRGVRDSNKQPLFKPNMQDPTRYDLDGFPINFPRNGSFDAATALMFCGDFSQFVWCFRQDITWKIVDQGVIQNPAGQIVYNTWQQGMVALVGTMRLAWQCPNPANRVQATEASRYPVGVLTP